METIADNGQIPSEEPEALLKAPDILVRLSKLIEAQTKELESAIGEPSHLNEAETGYNPTPAELASVFEGIKAEIEALGE